ncbi:MAG: glycosyltransferase family 2 protein [Thermoguttaceae bacterium]|nr:glycosyltransferase family 2 protein [Thermoguttaceae bacterium]
MDISVVIPVFNEEESLEELHRELAAVSPIAESESEIIFVDDGSTDGSWNVIVRLAEADPRVRGIRFRRNFGKAAALEAGFRASKGKTVFSMDADLQDDPAEIPAFLEMKRQTGLDVISGWKKLRHDPWHKVIPSRVFNFMVSRMTGVRLHDHNCGMKCYNREIFDEISLYGELHRFVPSLAAARGYKVGEKVIAHRARRFGRSKYGFNRFIKGFLDLLSVKFVTGYGKRPLHLFGTLGLLLFSLGAAILAYLAVRWGVSRLPCARCELYNLSGRPAVIYSAALMLLGGQLLSTGFIAELFLSYRKSKTSDYSVKESVGGLSSPEHDDGKTA